MNANERQYVVVLTVDEKEAWSDGYGYDDSIEVICSLLNGQITGAGMEPGDHALVQRAFSVRPLSEVIAC